MTTFEFLTPEWIDAARAARANHVTGELPFTVAMNLAVEDVPFGDGNLAAHLLVEGDTLDIDLGKLDNPDVSVTLDYATAKSVLVDGDGEAAMAAFMAGKLRVEGDMTKLLQFQSRQMTEGELALYAEIRSMTTP